MGLQFAICCVIYHIVWYHLWRTICYILYHTVWFHLWVASRNMFCVYHTVWYCWWPTMCYVLYHKVWKRSMHHNSQYVSLYTIQSSIACGPQFASFYTIQVGSACGSQICSMFHCIPHSLVFLMVDNLLRCIPYGRGSLMGCNSQCFLLDHVVWYPWWVAIRIVLVKTVPWRGDGSSPLVVCSRYHCHGS